MKKYLRNFSLSLFLWLLLVMLLLSKADIADILWIPIAALTTLNFIFILTLAALLVLKAWKTTERSVRVISVACFLSGLFFIEIDARSNGAKPGFTGTIDSGFKVMPEDSLIDYHTFASDEYGVTCFNAATAHNRYQGPFNSDGFNSPYEFSARTVDSLRAKGEKVFFFIGDSYTWGASADSGRSFAGLLDKASGYAVLNAGIPGTDPEQYKSVVKKYILSRKIIPDEVVIFLCSNDLYEPPRKPSPCIPLLYDTNAGLLYADGFATAAESYAQILNDITVRGILGNGWLTACFGQTVITSKLVNLLRFPLFIWQKKKYDFLVKMLRMLWQEILPSTPHTLEDYLIAIRQDCGKANVPVRIILVPGSEMVKNGVAPQIPGVISLDPKKLSPTDYADDDHPNNEGHEKIAQQIKDALAPTAKDVLY